MCVDNIIYTDVQATSHQPNLHHFSTHGFSFRRLQILRNMWITEETLEGSKPQ